MSVPVAVPVRPSRMIFLGPCLIKYLSKSKKNDCVLAKEQNIDEIATYIDHGFSGLDNNKPSLNQIQVDIRSSKVRAIIAIDEGQNYRNYFLASEWINNAEKMGVKLIFVNFVKQEYTVK